MINGYKDIFIEKKGRITKWNKQFESREKLEDIAQRIAAMSNKTINEAIPIVDTRLADGSRVNMVLSPIAIDGPVITIRKFYDTPIDIDRLIELGSITKEAADFLELLVKCRYNIFVSGGTGSGKTTFLNALSNFIPKDERVITIEDSAELQIQGVGNLVRLEVRKSNMECDNEVSIRDLIRSSLRMRPDRIIVGETRGEEALDMLQAMGTGHDGSLSTGHSNSSKDMLTRLRIMVLMGIDMPAEAIDRQIASAIDIIVHLKRMRDKTRKVWEIIRIMNLNLFHYISTLRRAKIKMEILLAHLKDRITALRILKSLSGQKTQEQCNVNLNKFIKRAHLSGRNDYIYLLQAVLIVTAVSYVFYDSLIPVIIFSPYVIYHIKKQRFNERYQKDNELIRQFRDGMQAVSFALNTGYSIENSFAEALQELVMLYGQNAVIVADFNMIVNRIRRNENLEDILDDYAASTNLDDIKYFAEIFRYAKRSGGDVIGIIKQTSHIIHEKAEVQQQIDTIITGKRLEQRVMVCMPLVITLYLRLTSPEYIDVLYGNVMGIIVMTICLLIYAAAVMLAQKITDINI